MATKTPTSTLAYSDVTASMQVDPEARHAGDAASVSISGAFPIDGARCATYPTTMEWVPDHERRVVPELMSALCRRCPARQSCLLWALAGREHGYWAGTTTADRTTMLELGQRSVESADELQRLARAELARQQDGDQPLHAPGRGSYSWYRQRCRCPECRAANSAQRAAERAKAKVRAGVAA